MKNFDNNSEFLQITDWKLTMISIYYLQMPSQALIFKKEYLHSAGIMEKTTNGISFE